MKTFIRSIAIFILIFYSVNSRAQISDPSFPDDWLGKWSGQLLMYNDTGFFQSVSMTVTNEATDTAGVYLWSLSYGENDVDRRPYILRTEDKSKGHYIIDECNGIKIKAFQKANKLISTFLVMGSEITSIYTKEKDYLIFEIIMNKREKYHVSGNLKWEGEEIPEVISYEIPIFQKAILYKTK